MRRASLLLALSLFSCGPRTMQVRLKDAERLAVHADGLLNEAQVAADAAEPEKLQRLLDDARRDVQDKDFALVSGAHEYLDRYNELAGRVPTVKQERERRDLVARIDVVKTQLAPRVDALSAAQAALPMSAPTTSAITEVEARAKELTDAVTQQQPLLTSTPESSQWTRQQLDASLKALDTAARAKKGVAFLEGPVTSWRDGLSLETSAKSLATPEEKQQALLGAKEKLTACATASRSFADDKSISAIAFTMPEGKPQTPGQLISTCQRALKPVEAGLKAAKKKKPGRK